MCGARVHALASDERNRHAPHSIATRATGGSGKFKLSGRKIHVLDGHVADRLIVTARTSGDVESRDGITLFLIDAKASGISVTRTPTVDSHNAATIELRDVTASDSDVIGTFDNLTGEPVLDDDVAQAAVRLREALGRFEDLRVGQEGFQLNGTVQAANIYTTDPSLSTKPFVALDDPQTLFGAQNVTPLVHRADLSDEAVETLNKVSAQLSTEDLIVLVGQVVTEGGDIDVVAAEWLQSAGIG